MKRLSFITQFKIEFLLPFTGKMPAHGSEGRATISRNLTEKGLVCKKETLRERRRNINSRLIRKYSTTEDLLFSTKNIIAVEEEMK